MPLGCLSLSPRGSEHLLRELMSATCCWFVQQHRVDVLKKRKAALEAAAVVPPDRMPRVVLPPPRQPPDAGSFDREVEKGDLAAGTDDDMVLCSIPDTAAAAADGEGGETGEGGEGEGGESEEGLTAAERVVVMEVYEARRRRTDNRRRFTSRAEREALALETAVVYDAMLVKRNCRFLNFPPPAGNQPMTQPSSARAWPAPTRPIAASRAPLCSTVPPRHQWRLPPPPTLQ